MADSASDDDRTPDKKRSCFAGAFGLSLAHVLSVFGMWYQTGFFVGNDVWVNFAIWLSPIIVLLVMGRTCAVVGILAVPLLVIFAARAYFAYERYSLGINSVGAKGDWAFWLATFTGVASVAILILWVLYKIAVFLQESSSARS